ncbi:MAG: GGDEF domain-containing protein [Aquabacterium sp.]|uniref:GGDEF domain-containing protein n=1 Tax=Aquabacterium sp. TaxID=1872578 RepID=UPI0025C0F950|nr:GGDEF domain-containing protein [Aquabacterium sp.]MBI3381141.1 GGDEF domain-containing protein [Aquabacterium sp.]
MLSAPNPQPHAPLLTETASPPAQPLGTKAPQGSQQSLNQALIDTTSRIMGAMYVYLALWLVITLVAGLQKTHPQLVWGTTIWLGAIAATRALVAHQLHSLLDHSPALAHRLTVGLVLVNGLTWGLLTAASVQIPSFEPIRTSMLLVSVGLSSGGTVAMAINPTLKVWFPVSVIAPVAIATATHASDSNFMLACLMVVYTVYVMHSARTVSQDYWRAQEAFRALEHASLTDPLTQVPNRLHFERQYQIEWRRACRLNTRIAVMIVDLDHFKRVNDEHGHPAGDIVLQEAAKAMSAAIMRPCDVLARYGGEEFIVLLPEITEEGAQVVAERLRTQVEKLEIALPSSTIHITCSVGYACLVPGHELDADDMVRQADQALYGAKTSGRNRCQGWTLPATQEASLQPAETDDAIL